MKRPGFSKCVCLGACGSNPQALKGYRGIAQEHAAFGDQQALLADRATWRARALQLLQKRVGLTQLLYQRSRADLLQVDRDSVCQVLHPDGCMLVGI